MAKPSSETKVTRIKAKDSGVKRVKTEAGRSKVEKAEIISDEPKKQRFGKRVTTYLKGSWRELTMVRWPDRKNTWKMTGALVMFTVAFAVIILLFDYVFQFVFKLLIGK